jgi:pimeloyl-ACP methyl ester carboxylesterase
VDEHGRQAPPEWFTRAVEQEPEQGEVVVEDCPVRWFAWGQRNRPTLTLVHGGAANAYWWTFLAPLLADEYRVVAPHLSGHGDSGRRPAYRSELWAEEVLAVTEAAGGHVGLPFVAGHSLGSQVAAVTAARHGERVGGTVLIDFGVRARGQRSQSAARAERNYRDQPTRADALARFRVIPWQPCENDYLVRHIAECSVVQRADGSWGWKFDPAVFRRSTAREMADYLADIRIPVALMPGADSRVVTPEITQRAVELLGRPVPVVTIPEAHHHLMLDQPLAFVSALRALLAAWRTPPAAP